MGTFIQAHGQWLTVTRPAGHAVADQAARQIRRWITSGMPGTPRG